MAVFSMLIIMRGIIFLRSDDHIIDTFKYPHLLRGRQLKPHHYGTYHHYRNYTRIFEIRFEPRGNFRRKRRNVLGNCIQIS